MRGTGVEINFCSCLFFGSWIWANWQFSIILMAALCLISQSAENEKKPNGCVWRSSSFAWAWFEQTSESERKEESVRDGMGMNNGFITEKYAINHLWAFSTREGGGGLSNWPLMGKNERNARRREKKQAAPYELERVKEEALIMQHKLTSQFVRERRRRHREIWEKGSLLTQSALCLHTHTSHCLHRRRKEFALLMKQQMRRACKQEGKARIGNRHVMKRFLHTYEYSLFIFALRAKRRWKYSR
jgi:hypothetical protein